MVYIVILVVLSIVLGAYIIRRSTASAAASGGTRDRIRIAAEDRVLSVIDTWAARHGYAMSAEPDGSRVYQSSTKGTAMPVFLRVERIDDQFELQSWVRASGFGGGGELALAAGGIALSLPRKQARKPHNELRAELGLPTLG